MKSILIKEIAERIKTELSEIEFIDIYKGQDRTPEKYYPFPLPAVFIEIININWQDQTHGYQYGDCDLRIHVITDNARDTFNSSESNSDAIDELKLSERVWAALEGIEGDCYTKLNRRRELYDGKMMIDFKTTISQKIEKETQTKTVELNILK